MQITNIHIKLNSNALSNNVLAYASIVLDYQLKINGIKIVSNRTGNKLIVVLPEYAQNPVRPIQYVVPMDKVFREYINKTLLERYTIMVSASNTKCNNERK